MTIMQIWLFQIGQCSDVGVYTCQMCNIQSDKAANLYLSTSINCTTFHNILFDYPYILCYQSSSPLTIYFIWVCQINLQIDNQFQLLSQEHISVSKLTSIGSNNNLSPGRCQAIIWTKAGILLIGPSVTNFSEILIEIHSRKSIWKYRLENGGHFV